ncbi:MAG: LuxR C-terminal-related transcriptional regulator [Planctomycetia bacterium]|nr:LuxR C-terminal-related transcriptional regulator [Planctomycetia bacterium]
MQRTSTIHIVDPDPLSVNVIRGLFTAHPPKFLAHRTAAAFLEQTEVSRPACVICELTLPDRPGVKLIEEIRQASCPLPVIALAANPTVRATVDAMIAGAMFVLEKPGDATSLQRLITSAVSKDAEQLQRCQELRQLSLRFSLLSPREREVADLIFQGLETKTIAAKLGISPKTVEYHRAQIFAKMEVSNAVQLTVALLRLEKSRV